MVKWSVIYPGKLFCIQQTKHVYIEMCDFFPPADLLLALPLLRVQKAIQGTPLGDKPLCVVPERSLSCA